MTYDALVAINRINPDERTTIWKNLRTWVAVSNAAVNACGSVSAEIGTTTSNLAQQAASIIDDLTDNRTVVACGRSEVAAQSIRETKARSRVGGRRKCGGDGGTTNSSRARRVSAGGS